MFDPNMDILFRISFGLDLFFSFKIKKQLKLYFFLQKTIINRNFIKLKIINF